MSEEKRSRITTTRFMRIWHRRRRREKEHDDRLAEKRAQIRMAETLKESWESQGNISEVKRLTARVRLLQQELRYMQK